MIINSFNKDPTIIKKIKRINNKNNIFDFKLFLIPNYKSSLSKYLCEIDNVYKM